jgi:hypothetical protein
MGTLLGSNALITPVETVSNLEGQIAIYLILLAKDVVTEEGMLGKAMVAVAMAMATAEAPLQANILFNQQQSCLPYGIKLSNCSHGTTPL